ALDAETRVPGLLRQFLAIGDRDFDLDIAAAELGNDLAHHLTGDRVDRRLAGRDRQTRFCDRADTLTRTKDNAASFRGKAHGRDDGASMSDVRIIAGILDDSSLRPAVSPALDGQCEGRRLTLGKSNRHRI